MSESAAGRKRDPHYTVLELRALQEPARQWGTVPEDGGKAESGWEPGADVQAWVPLAEGVRAKNDRDAIDKALDEQGRQGEARLGTFCALLVGTLKPRVKARETREVEVWA